MDVVFSVCIGMRRAVGARVCCMFVSCVQFPKLNSARLAVC